MDYLGSELKRVPAGIQADKHSYKNKLEPLAVWTTDISLQEKTASRRLPTQVLWRLNLVIREQGRGETCR